MWIIVDSGSTKADWQVVHEDLSQETIHTIGFNPFYFNEEGIATELKKSLVSKINADKVKAVYFYGAGCSDAFRCAIVSGGLYRVFPNAKIEVEHDLLGAARAVCGREPGIACILGTGSNSCLYDGEQVIDNITSLGFFLGDEGSGAHLGKLLLQAYFYRELPDDIQSDFEREYPEGKRAIINKVYAGSANVYCASFATFLAARKQHAFVQKLIIDAFDEFLRRNVQKYAGYNNLPINFVGSIAFHFKDLLEIALAEKNLKLGNVIKKPIEPLVDFHLAHLYKSNK
jgi:N-acetylglucosamine kinase-like BadF-type ATPase